MNQRDYPLELRPLSPADGGGWLVTFPDLPGCMADGETPEQAIQEGWDAAAAWLAVAAQYHFG
ncbi:MAG: type II toxin-antitoxin system HicB family antitoxin [Candidatus Contendobacter sp.]|nr:type II toxin-antitoxin system HicB family antitoxin [Candidatus Contendobacter sp.]